MPEAQKDQPKKVRSRADDAAPRPPDWTEGLKRLYDSVVEEPLPDAFKDLLARLDGDEQ